MATPDSPATAPKTSNINVRRGEPLVVVDHIDKHFGDLHVLKDINTVVNRGEVVVVIGPSGSGKSTLCRAINRLETIDSGTITIDGAKLPEEGAGLAKLRADVGMVFQSFNLFAHKTVLENVTLGPIRVRGMKKKAADEKAMQLLDRVGVANQAQKMPSQLSGGQQQRVAIARSLAMDPKLILMDEPTSAHCCAAATSASSSRALTCSPAPTRWRMSNCPCSTAARTRSSAGKAAWPRWTRWG